MHNRNIKGKEYPLLGKTHGHRIRFLIDQWTGPRPLELLFPDTFAIPMKKEAKIAGKKTTKTGILAFFLFLFFIRNNFIDGM